MGRDSGERGWERSDPPASVIGVVTGETEAERRPPDVEDGGVRGGSRSRSGALVLAENGAPGPPAAFPRPGGLRFQEDPGPYWFVRPAPPEELEVVVVGGGLVGLATARWIAACGRRVTVLEADRIGGGASGRNTGMLLTGSFEPFTEMVERVGREKALRFWRLTAENRTLLGDALLGREGLECDFDPSGSWRACRPGSATEAAWRESVELLRDEGFDLEWRSPQRVREACGSPLLGGAVFTPGDGGLDPLRLCRGLADAPGVEVRRGVRIREVAPHGDWLRLRWRDGEAVAERVVLAVNAYVAPLVPEAAEELRPLRVEVLATGPGPRWLPGVWTVHPDRAYLRQLADGTLLMAGGGRPAAGDTGYIELPTAGEQGAMEARLRELFPALGPPAVHYRWAGTLALTPDGLPRIGRLEGSDAAVYACGFNGHGLSLGFAVARRLAAWVEGDDEVLGLFG